MNSSTKNQPLPNDFKLPFIHKKVEEKSNPLMNKKTYKTQTHKTSSTFTIQLTVCEFRYYAPHTYKNRKRSPADKLFISSTIFHVAQIGRSPRSYVLHRYGLLSMSTLFFHGQVLHFFSKSTYALSLDPIF